MMRVRFPSSAPIETPARWWFLPRAVWVDSVCLRELDTNRTRDNQAEPLKASLRPMRGLLTDRTASTVIRDHAFIQNVRRGHYELGVDARHERLRLAAAFDELTTAI